MKPALALLLALACCGGPDAEAPVPIGFTGRCKLDVHHAPGGVMSTFFTPDELKTHIQLDVVKDTLVAIHVELPDTRSSSSLEQLPDNALMVGYVKSDAVLDRGGDVDVPVSLRRKDGADAEPWDLSVRIRFRGDHAEVVAGRMIVTGACLRPSTLP